MLYSIPNELGILILQLKDISVTEYSIISDGYIGEANEYLEYLVEGEFGCWIPAYIEEQLRCMSFDWHHPGEINDVVIELTLDAIESLPVLIDELCRYGMRHAYLLIPQCTSQIATRILDAIGDSAIRGFEASITAEEGERARVMKILETEPRFGEAQVLDPGITLKDDLNKLRMLFEKAPSKESIIISQKFYSEALYYNPAFNRRVYIDVEGMYFYGKPLSTGVSSIAELFSKMDNGLAKITKGEIDVCKDCDFRMVCYDTRTPLKRKSEGWYFLSECNYNPYICKWNDEEGYRTLAECGVVSNAEGFSIDHDRIAAINAELWGE